MDRIWTEADGIPEDQKQAYMDEALSQRARHAEHWADYAKFRGTVGDLAAAFSAVIGWHAVSAAVAAGVGIASFPALVAALPVIATAFFVADATKSKMAERRERFVAGVCGEAQLAAQWSAASVGIPIGANQAIERGHAIAKGDPLITGDASDAPIDAQSIADSVSAIALRNYRLRRAAAADPQGPQSKPSSPA